MLKQHTAITHTNSLKAMANNNSPDNSSVYHTPPEEIFPVFQYEYLDPNNQPQDLFPVFQNDNPPPLTPPEVLFPPLNYPPHHNPPTNYQPQHNPPQPDRPPQNQQRALTDEELYEQDMQEVLRVQAEEEEEARIRAAYLRGKQERRNRRALWRMQNGLPRVPSSEDDSSASSNEGYVSDDSIF